MALLSDGSLPTLYDFAVDGVGYQVAWEFEKAPWSHAYVENLKDVVIERTDLAADATLTENKMDYLVWDSQRSWHEGAGQLRFDAKTSSPDAFQSSTGIDISVPGKATLLPDTLNHGISTSVVTPISTVSQNIVFSSVQQAGTNRLVKWTPYGVTDTNWSLSTNAVVLSLTSDGKKVYAALGASGVDSGDASGTSSTSFSATDARAISWEKQQLVGAGVKSGTQWRLVSWPAAGGAATELLALPDGYLVAPKAITSTSGFIYFGAYSDHISVIYAWDGTNPPFVALRLPEGDQVLSLQALHGQYVMIGARRFSGVSTSKGQGVLFSATASSSGFLDSTEIATFGTYGDTTTDYAITDIVERGKRAYFQLPPLGLGVFDPEFASYSTHIANTASGTGGGYGCVWQGKLIFSQMGINDVRHETFNISTPSQVYYVTSGQIIGSIMDWNIDATKIVVKGEAGFTLLPTGTKCVLDYSFDEGVTYTTVGTVTGGTSLSDVIGNTTKSIVYRVTIYSDTTKTLTPTLKKVGFGAWYGDKPRTEHVIAVKAFDRMKLKNGTAYPGESQTQSEQVYSKLRALYESQKLVDFQPPGYGETHTRHFKVNLREIEARTGWIPGTGYGKNLICRFIEIPGTRNSLWSEFALHTWGNLNSTGTLWGNV